MTENCCGALNSMQYTLLIAKTHNGWRVNIQVIGCSIREAAEIINNKRERVSGG